jgi:hypothetical protein
MQRKENPGLASIAIRSAILFAAISSIGFPLFVSVFLLTNQMGGVIFAIIAALVFGAVLALILIIHGLLHDGAIKPAISSFPSTAFIKFRWLTWILITALVFLISNHLLVRGLAVGIWDTDGQYYPYQVLVADFARIGRFIHWDPWSAGGLPLLGDPQVGAFSPINFAIGLLAGGTSWGFKCYWLLTWWLGGFGIIMLARHLKAPAWGGCLVALGFLFCGVYTGNAQHTSFIAAFSYLPVIVWRLDVSLCSRKIWASVEAGALWGLSALAGYPGVTIITGSFCAIWAIGRLHSHESFAVDHSADNSSWLRATAKAKIGFFFTALGLVLLVGLAVLSPTYFAFLFEGAGTHARAASLSRDIAVYDNALDPGALSTFASPYLATLKAKDQLSGQNHLWPYTDLSMCSVYTGAITFVLALFAIVMQRRDRWRWWLIGLGALSLACAAGQALPLRGWLYDWLYPMRFFRHAAIFRYYYVFAISVLALLGIRDISLAIQQKADRAWKCLLATSLFAALVALLVFVNIAGSVDPAESSNNQSINQATGTWIVVSGTWLGVCAIAYLGRILRFQQKTWLVPALFLLVAGSDAYLTASISQIMMLSTDPVAVSRWRQLDQNHSADIDLTTNGLLREESSCQTISRSHDFEMTSTCLLNDQYITKIPVLESYTTMKNSYHLRMLQNALLTGMASGGKRFWFSKEMCQVKPTEECFSAFVARTEALAAPPLLIHTPDALLAHASHDETNEINARLIPKIEALPACEQIRVDLIRYLPDELVFDVQSRADGWLLVTDRWARSWQAEVNGVQAVVYGGNFIFRAIQVSAGNNHVKFAYTPKGFPWLIIVSWGTLALVAIRVPLGGVFRKK